MGRLVFSPQAAKLDGRVRFGRTAGGQIPQAGKILRPGVQHRALPQPPGQGLGLGLQPGGIVLASGEGAQFFGCGGKGLVGQGLAAGRQGGAGFGPGGRKRAVGLGFGARSLKGDGTVGAGLFLRLGGARLPPGWISGTARRGF